VSAILQLLGWFLLWVGLVVTIVGWFVWKKNKSAIFLATIVGGFSDMGYFVFIDLNGRASTSWKINDVHLCYLDCVVLLGPLED
jgi:hypothetical protein